MTSQFIQEKNLIFWSPRTLGFKGIANLMLKFFSVHSVL